MKAKIENHFRDNYHTFFDKYLTGVKKIGGNEYQALCPFHADTNPSFSFNNETGAFYCFGCEEKGDVFTFYQKRHGCDFKTALTGLAEIAGVNGNGSQPTRQQKIKGRVVAKFVYTDEKGNPLHRTVKSDPKNFHQERYDPKKGWSKGLGKTRLVLYNLPKVLKAQDVFFPEGEKDCESLARLGFVATCNPMGSGKLPKQQEKHNILGPLKGKQLFILIDNDEPGKKHGEQLANLAHGKAREIRIVSLPGLPKGGDVSNFIEIHGDKAKTLLIEQVAVTPTWTPPKNFFTAGDLLSTSYELKKPIIGKGIMPDNSHIIISGEPGVGKSLLREELALHLVVGWDWLGFEISTARKVAIFQYENSEQIEQTRLRRMCYGLGIREIPKGRLVYVDRKNRINLSLKGDRKRLQELVRESEAEVIFYDCLSNLHAAKENDNIQMRDILDSLTEINAILGTSCVVIHHFGKPTEGQGNAYRTRGASSIIDWAVTAAAFIAKPHESKILRQLEFFKVRDGAVPKPLLLERDEDFLLSVTDEDTLCPASKVKEILQDLGGSVDFQRPLVEAIMEEASCSNRSARTYLKRAVEMKVIRTQNSGQGKRKAYHVVN